jgi:hypothetical protein
MSFHLPRIWRYFGKAFCSMRITLRSNVQHWSYVMVRRSCCILGASASLDLFAWCSPARALPPHGSSLFTPKTTPNSSSMKNLGSPAHPSYNLKAGFRQSNLKQRLAEDLTFPRGEKGVRCHTMAGLLKIWTPTPRSLGGPLLYFFAFALTGSCGGVIMCASYLWSRFFSHSLDILLRSFIICSWVLPLALLLLRSCPLSRASGSVRVYTYVLRPSNVSLAEVFRIQQI